MQQPSYHREPDADVFTQAPMARVLPVVASRPAHVASTEVTSAATVQAPRLSVTSPAQAESGWRGTLNRFGLHLAPGRVEAERVATMTAADDADRLNRMLVQQAFRRPMTAALVNTKGGAGKTPSTVCLSAVFGVLRGGSSVAWCNNETHGTLAARTDTAGVRETVWDLLQGIDQFESATARLGDLGRYLRPQGDSRFDALVSSSSPTLMQQMSREDCLRIHAVLARFYRTIFIDTGNNVLAPAWQASVEAADALVVPVDHTADTVANALLALDHLDQTGRSDLARNAVVVVTPSRPFTVLGRTDPVDALRARTERVVEVPFDPAIAAGGPLRWQDLSDLSQRAWVAVAANVAQTFSLTEHTPEYTWSNA